MTSVSGSVTVGIDIGSTSVKAVAVDDDGRVQARVRVPHRLLSSAPDRLEHDAGRAWRRNPRQALASVTTGLEVAAVGLAAMVPSLTAVDARGVPRLPGLLYGDARGFPGGTPPAPSAMPDAEGFVRWALAERPDAAGYWPAQAVASYALAHEAVIDTAVSATLGPLLYWGAWSAEALGALGLDEARLPRIVPMGEAAGTVDGLGVPLAAGSVDALCDQIVAGAGQVGDVLVVCGATLIVWVVTDTWVEVPGLWTIPHTTPDRVLVGGPSNAGALFVDWARSLLRAGPRAGDPVRPADPGAVPVWLPYVRGERVPFHDPGLRASLHGLDLTHGPAAIRRAAYEAGGFVIRRIVERSGVAARRVVASGGGTRSDAWMAALADATGLPVEVVAVSEGAALGAAWLGRMAVGLESDLTAADRWARTGRRVDPDPAWAEAAAARYDRFVAAGPPG